jgi:hypothetical protein
LLIAIVAVASFVMPYAVLALVLVALGVWGGA